MGTYDIVIVGAGTAGSFAAQLASKAGYSVAFLDRKKKNEIGEKICGDEISATHFEAVGLEKPQGNEISSAINGADLYPPNLKNPMVLREWKEFNGWTVNRKVFGQRLLNDAISSGADLLPEHHVIDCIKDGNQVTGVVTKDFKNNKTSEIKGKVVIDASGYPGVLRLKVEDPLIEKEINPQDVAVCYREIIELPEDWEEEGIAEVIMSIDGHFADHGYCWLFPKGGKYVNVGTGVRGGKGITNPKKLFNTLKKEHPKLKNAKTVYGGSDVVPVRRTIWSLVSNGIMFLGDAALQVNPMHGGGIGRGLRAAKMAVDTLVESLEKGDTSATGLWEYNMKFHKELSPKLVPLDLFRIMIQSFSDDDINYGFEKKVIESSDLMNVNRGENIKFDFKQKMTRVRRGVRKIDMLLKLNKTIKSMKKVKELYRNYPSSPEGLNNFKEEVLKEYSIIRNL
ncbi:MAG: geranylgeranyl reductase family protein [Candidatus Ranarchaeia archaeon]